MLMGKSRDLRRQREHHKAKTLEHKVTTSYEQIERTALEYQTAPESILCGYLRQQIHLTKQPDYVTISGCCALNDSTCTRSTGRNAEGYVHDSCKLYYQIVEGKNVKTYK